MDKLTFRNTWAPGIFVTVSIGCSLRLLQLVSASHFLFVVKGTDNPEKNNEHKEIE